MYAKGVQGAMSLPQQPPTKRQCIFKENSTMGLKIKVTYHVRFASPNAHQLVAMCKLLKGQNLCKKLYRVSICVHLEKLNGACSYKQSKSSDHCALFLQENLDRIPLK